MIDKEALHLGVRMCVRECRKASNDTRTLILTTHWLVYVHTWAIKVSRQTLDVCKSIRRKKALLPKVE
jgi:hypothetical protein